MLQHGIAPDGALQTKPNQTSETNTLTEFVEPLGTRILIRKDESRQQTAKGENGETPEFPQIIIQCSAGVVVESSSRMGDMEKV